MVKNVDDDPEETKSIFVENSRDVKPPKVEAKLNLDGASIHVKAKLNLDGVSINKIPITISISVFWSFTGIFQVFEKGQFLKGCFLCEKGFGERRVFFFEMALLM
ncbi:hypothetical protein MTR_2g050030 [Medicago truncatula]|uniref:Uncharacterized protein n=1 Tax=Medicago truncatula TaxID=3880 RepID=G7IQH7_MEDTR|nr:hypothetical protein MTR_2g050030 [Medicago truncatula]